MGANGVSEPSWSDPQIHIASAMGKSTSSFLEICDFIPNAIEEELVIGGQGVVKFGPKTP